MDLNACNNTIRLELSNLKLNRIILKRGNDILYDGIYKDEIPIVNMNIKECDILRLYTEINNNLYYIAKGSLRYNRITATNEIYLSILKEFNERLEGIIKC